MSLWQTTTGFLCIYVTFQAWPNQKRDTTRRPKLSFIEISYINIFANPILLFLISLLYSMSQGRDSLNLSYLLSKNFWIANFPEGLWKWFWSLSFINHSFQPCSHFLGQSKSYQKLSRKDWATVIHMKMFFMQMPFASLYIQKLSFTK